MDQIFLVDTMQTQRVLDVICGHLPLKDLLKFEAVTPQTRAAVRALQFDRKILFLGLPDRDLTRHLVGNDGVQLAGPTITRMALALELSSESIDLLLQEEPEGPATDPLLNPYEWDWMVSTLRRRAAHLKELELRLKIKNSFYVTHPIVIIRGAMEYYNEHALTTGVVFSQCTKLRLHFNGLHGSGNTGPLLADLLRHFPVVEHLTLSGNRRLPLVSFLPAPHKLKSLILDFRSLRTVFSGPIVADFSGLESLSVSFFGSHVHQVKTYVVHLDTLYADVFLDHLSTMSGVDWVASFQRHPPTHLQHVYIPILANWTVSLLAASSSAPPPPESSLTIDYITEMESELAEAIRYGPVGQYLERVTRLSGSFRSEKAIGELLAFTPSLTVLEVDLDILSYGDDYEGEDRFDLAHPLRFLTKLIILKKGNYGVSPTWIESVRRNSPPGLEVVTKQKESFSRVNDYQFDVSGEGEVPAALRGNHSGRVSFFEPEPDMFPF